MMAESLKEDIRFKQNYFRYQILGGLLDEVAYDHLYYSPHRYKDSAIYDAWFERVEEKEVKGLLK